MAMETTLATVWLMMLRMFEAEGIDSARVLRDIGVPVSILSDPEARLPSKLADRAFARAVELGARPGFGLRAAECWHPSNLGTLGYAWLSCLTLRRGLRRTERYARILGNRFTYTGFDDPDGFRFVYEHGRGHQRIGWAMSDFTLSILIDMCRTNAGRRLAPKRVCLRRPCPESQQVYLDFFGGEVRFDQTEDSFLLDPEDADSPLPTANKVMATTFDEILATQLKALVDNDLVTRCRTYLLETFSSGDPVEADLATAMGLSQRSLQRHLQHLGWSYKRLVEDTRMDLARRYLADPRRSLTEIAFLLGFSEQSAFSRSFKRWLGQSPSDFRAALR